MDTITAPATVEQAACCMEVKQRLEKSEASRAKLRSTLVMLKVRWPASEHYSYS
jgi:hypothetical protein